MSFEITLSQVLIVSLLLPLSYFVAKWLFQKDTKRENRKRAALKLASRLEQEGLKVVPKILECYGVDDWSGMADQVLRAADLIEQGEDQVMIAFDKIRDNVINAMLSKEQGRAYLAAKLADAVKPVDPSAVQNAPAAKVSV
jgi:hypothetical protein